MTQTTEELWMEELENWEEGKVACQVTIEEIVEGGSGKEGYWSEECCDLLSYTVETKQDLCTELVVWNPGKDGITLLELFSGIGVGLEAVLSAGIQVKCYICVETCWQAQIVARERVKQMRLCFPDLISDEALRGFQSTLPAHVRLLGELHLQALDAPIDMLVVGWECQGMSNAGKGAGLKHKQSALFTEVVRIMSVLQRQAQPCMYVVENIPACFDRREEVRKEYRRIKEWLGAEVMLDAAQLGSSAHRLRSF